MSLAMLVSDTDHLGPPGSEHLVPKVTVYTETHTIQASSLLAVPQAWLSVCWVSPVAKLESSVRRAG